MAAKGGKTDKEKAKDKAKSAAKGKFSDKVPKILKDGAGGGKQKKKVYLTLIYRNGQNPSRRINLTMLFSGPSQFMINS
jgi:hypothetical protein